MMSTESEEEEAGGTHIWSFRGTLIWPHLSVYVKYEDGRRFFRFIGEVLVHNNFSSF